jgi:hypothetical protein
VPGVGGSGDSGWAKGVTSVRKGALPVPRAGTGARCGHLAWVPLVTSLEGRDEVEEGLGGQRTSSLVAQGHGSGPGLGTESCAGSRMRSFSANSKSHPNGP